MSDFKTKVQKIGRELFCFLSSKIFLKNLAGMLALVAALLTLSFFWMSSYTHHGESLQVPNLVNMNIDAALEKATKENLKIIVNDSIWSGDIPAGTVIEQNPVALSKVKKNRTIYLTITKFQAEEKLLPTLAGNDNYNYYARKLKHLKIDLSVKSKQFSNKLEENTILYLYVNDEKVTADDLKNGVKVPQGSTVEAVVTTKGGGRVGVPDLVCKRYSDAEFLINGSKLNASVIKDATVTSLENAYVWKQSPAYSSGKTLGVGDVITVYVKKRLPENCN